MSEIMKASWYHIQARSTGAGNQVTIHIHDEIGAGGITSKQFVQALDVAVAGTADVLVSINSPGGDVFDALAIYNALMRYRSRVTASVEGIAASAASVILMAAKEIRMPENAMIMIHNPWTIAGGESKDLRKTAEMMDKVRSSMVAAYVERTGRPESEIVQMMDDTTWMDAHQAKELGFCDSIESPVRLAASARALDVLAKYPAVPRSLLAGLTSGRTLPAAPARTSSHAELVDFVYAQCRQHGVPNMAEPILASGDLLDMVSAKARVQAAAEIQALCTIGRVSDKATSFVAAGLDVEHVRERVLTSLVESSDAVEVSNLQRDPGIAGDIQQMAMQRLADDVYARRQARNVQR